MFFKRVKYYVNYLPNNDKGFLNYSLYFRSIK